MKQTKLSVTTSQGRATLDYVLDESEFSEAELAQDFEERKVGSPADTYWSTALVSSLDPPNCPIAVKRRLYSEIGDNIEARLQSISIDIQRAYLFDSTEISKQMLHREPRQALLTAEQVHDSTLSALEWIKLQTGIANQLSHSQAISPCGAGAGQIVATGPTSRLQHEFKTNNPGAGPMSTKSKRILKRRNSKALQTQMDLKLCSKIIGLSRREGIAQVAIAKRLGVSLYKVKQALGLSKNKRVNGRILSNPRIRFSRITDSARQGLMDYIQSSHILLQSSDMQKYLKAEHKVQISRPYLQRFLREEIGASYQRVGIVTPNQNSLECKAQRQKAAQEYIRLSCSGQTIINIDESVLQYTDHRTRGWSLIGQRTRQVFRQRLPSHNIIAGVSNKGDIFFTINKGKTNSFTFLLFITKLVHQLDHQDQNWRQSTVLLLDNAAYHRSKITRDFISKFALPVMYLGPYNFHMAPVEKFFAFIKARPLNPDSQRTTGQEFSAQYMQKLGRLIRLLDYSWLTPMFAKSLLHAINCLCLEDI